jgi:integrase
VWRTDLGPLPFLGIPYSMLVRIADTYPCSKKTYNNAISALRRAFTFGYLDYPERRDPAAALECARLGKKDRPPIDPFSIQDAEVLIAALHRNWGEAYGDYDELRFFTGLRPSEEIALVVTDYDACHGVLSVTKTRVNGIDQVGGQGTRPSYFNHVVGLRGLGGGRGRGRHCRDPGGDESYRTPRTVIAISDTSSGGSVHAIP